MAAASEPIRFYSHVKGPFRALSNFAWSPVTLRGKSWATAEHYFQAAKFFGTDEEWAETIRTAETPGEAKALGQSRKHPLRADWDAARIEVMREVLRVKFAPGTDLAVLLLSSGDAPLIEASPTDYFWGEGRHRTGTNWLGRVLEEVRAELRAHA